MNEKTKKLVNDYYNGITDLQHKLKKDKENFVLLALLLVFIVDYLTTSNKAFSKNEWYLLEDIDITDVDNNIKDFGKAIKGKGSLKVGFETFKDRMSPILNYITKLVKLPPKAPSLAIFKKARYDSLEEESALKAATNNISLMVNQMIFQKSYKTWNTQNDEFVRKTTFHNSVKDERIPINDKFVVGADKGMFPNDPELPNVERFNCRCYLTYE